MNTVTGGPAIVISTTASSSYMVSRGEGRGGDQRSQGPRIPHFPEENDLVMAVKRQTESTFQSGREEEQRRNYLLFTSWQNIKLGNFLLSPSILANLLFNFGFLHCLNELNSFKLRSSGVSQVLLEISYWQLGKVDFFFSKSSTAQI